MIKGRCRIENRLKYTLSFSTAAPSLLPASPPTEHPPLPRSLRCFFGLLACKEKEHVLERRLTDTEIFKPQLPLIVYQRLQLQTNERGGGMGERGREFVKTLNFT